MKTYKIFFVLFAFVLCALQAFASESTCSIPTAPQGYKADAVLDSRGLSAPAARLLGRAGLYGKLLDPKTGLPFDPATYTRLQPCTIVWAKVEDQTVLSATTLNQSLVDKKSETTASAVSSTSNAVTVTKRPGTKKFEQEAIKSFEQALMDAKYRNLDIMEGDASDQLLIRYNTDHYVELGIQGFIQGLGTSISNSWVYIAVIITILILITFICFCCYYISKCDTFKGFTGSARVETKLN